MSLYKSISSFLRDIIVAPDELEKNRREFKKNRTMVSIHLERTIFNVIISCKTDDHVASCRHWVGYLLTKKIINLLMFEGLNKALDLKEVEVTTTKSIPALLPHLKTREEAIAKGGKVRPMRVVRSVEAN